MTRNALNDRRPLETLQSLSLTGDQHRRLFESIDALLQDATTARAPRNRPPGRAGLRAEKGYYRLLYLMDEFRRKVGRRPSADADATPYDWASMTAIIDQLADIPELRAEILDGIAATLERVTAR